MQWGMAAIGILVAVFSLPRGSDQVLVAIAILAGLLPIMGGL